MKIQQRSLLTVCGGALFALACGGQVSEGGPGAEIITEEGPVYQGPAAEDPQAQADPAAEARVLTLVNQARAVARSCGTTAYPAAPALAREARLDRAAAIHSTDMATKNFFSHTGSDGSSPFVRMQRQGYKYGNAGVSASIHALGMVAQDTGDYAGAKRLYEQSLALKRELGDRAGVDQTAGVRLAAWKHCDGRRSERAAVYGDRGEVTGTLRSTALQPLLSLERLGASDCLGAEEFLIGTLRFGFGAALLRGAGRLPPESARESEHAGGAAGVRGCRPWSARCA